MANRQPPLATGRRAVELAILAKGTASLRPGQLAEMRQQSLDRFPTPLRPQFLKHSDDQTLAALTAMTRAIEAHGLAADGFRDWAIVSSSRYLGRTAFAAVIDKYRVDGPWGVSVQVIPHATPHAVAGTISLALGSHGPSIGVGTAEGEESQVLLAAATLLQRPHISGAWILLTGWSYERRSFEPAEAAPPRTCTAAVLAVADAESGAGRQPALGRLEIEPCGPEEWGYRLPEREPARPLAELLAEHHSAPLSWGETCRGMRTRLELRAEESLFVPPRVSRAA